MWIFFAVGASIFWGLSYILQEQVYKKISVYTSLAIISAIMLLLMIIGMTLSGRFKSDLIAIASSRQLLWLVMLGVITSIIAEIFIALSISTKNATLAGLIEISYPIFIALFAYVLFKENQLNLPTAIGGALIFSGVFLIYFFNK